jgi:hypothetical protein
MINIASNLPQLTGKLNAMGSGIKDHEHKAMVDLAKMTIKIINRPGYCPRDTGTLVRGHKVAEPEQGTANVVNSVEYWIYVVYGSSAVGTSYLGKMIPGTGRAGIRGNNYLQRALQTMHSEGHFEKIIRKHIHEGAKGAGLG